MRTPNLTPRVVFYTQGEVWQALKLVLSTCGIAMRQPRHARGYEVDAEILAPSRSLLVEIKTATTAAEVYGGIGQLAVYPVLLPDLSKHKRILLLPGEPANELCDALQKCCVELHWFRLRRCARRVEVRFSKKFLSRCGVPSEKLADLRAL